MKKAGDFRSSWGGIAGVQSTLSVLLDRGHHARQLALERIVSLVAATPAERFRLPSKGRIQVGFDADLVLVDSAKSFTLGAADLQQRHKISPYIGSTFRGTVRRTIRRGETIFSDGKITATSKGSDGCPRRSCQALSASTTHLSESSGVDTRTTATILNPAWRKSSCSSARETRDSGVRPRPNFPNVCVST